MNDKTKINLFVASGVLAAALMLLNLPWLALIPTAVFAVIAING